MPAACGISRRLFDHFLLALLQKDILSHWVRNIPDAPPKLPATEYPDAHSREPHGEGIAATRYVLHIRYDADDEKVAGDNPIGMEVDQRDSRYLRHRLQCLGKALQTIIDALELTGLRLSCLQSSEATCARWTPRVVSPRLDLPVSGFDQWQRDRMAA